MERQTPTSRPSVEVEIDESRASDRRVLEALAKSDLESGQLLHAKVSGVIRAAASRVLGATDPEHEDLVQSSFEHLVRTLTNGQYDGRCSLTTWAGAITTRLGLHLIRTRQSRRRFAPPIESTADSLEESAEGEVMEARLLAREQLSLVEGELSRMPSERVEAFLILFSPPQRAG